MAKMGLFASDQERIQFFAEAIAINEPITRREFEVMISARVRQAERCIDNALALAGLEASQADNVLNTGLPR